MKKTSLLSLLVVRHPELSKKDLHALILCGEVLVNGEKIRDPRYLCPPETDINLVRRRKFVSRGGEKLDHALEVLGIDCRDRIFLDCGASTGGFTHCLLSRGARRVYAIDVGYAQFDYTLRADPRVALYERTNVMGLGPDSFSPPPQAAVIDLSFRSLAGAAPYILHLVTEHWAVALIKPQFEWEHPARDFDGVVRDEKTRREILLSCADNLLREGVYVRQAVVSPLAGAKGNREYFFLVSLDGKDVCDAEKIITPLFDG